VPTKIVVNRTYWTALRLGKTFSLGNLKNFIDFVKASIKIGINL
jgi:hypothetical protein